MSPTQRCFSSPTRPRSSPATSWRSTTGAAFSALPVNLLGRLRQVRCSLAHKRHALHLDDPIPRKAAPDGFAAPAAADAFNPVEVVAGAIALAWRHWRSCRRRRRADHRDAALRPLELDQRVHVVMAVNDELRPVPCQCCPKFGAVDEPLQMPRGLADRRMMDHHHAKELLAAAALQGLGKLFDLL